MEEQPLEAVVDDAIAESDGHCVTVRSILEAWDDRSYGPLFILLGFFGGTPLAVIPGAAALVGVAIFLLAVQMAFGKAHPWLPDFLLNRSTSEKKLKKVRKDMASLLAFIDRLITQRWAWAVGGGMRRFSAVIVSVLGLAMIPFDAVPFIVAAPAWTVVLFGVALTARDGLVMVLALAATSAVIYLGTTLL